MKKIICIVLAIFLLTGCNANNDSEETTPLQTTVPTQSEQSTLPETTPEPPGVPEGWYLPLLGKTNFLQEYSLFDLDADGTRELIMKVGISEANTRYVFYGYNGEAYYLGEMWQGSSQLVSEGDGLILYGYEKNYEWAYRIVKNGTKIQNEKLFEGYINGNYHQYPIVVETYIYVPEKQPHNTVPATTPAQTTPVETTPATTTPAETTPAATTPTKATVTAQGEPFGNIRSWHSYHAPGWTEEVLIETNVSITSVKVLKLGENMDGGTVVESTVYTLATLSPDKPLVLGVSFVDVMPLYGIRYTDTDGSICYYAIDESLVDGSISLRRFSPAKADPVSYGNCCNCGKALTYEEAKRETLVRESWCDTCRACPQCGELIYQNSLDTFGDWLCYYCAFAKYACAECGGLPGECRCARCPVCGWGMGDCNCEPCAACGNRLESCTCEKCPLCGEVPGLCWCCYCERCGRAIEWSDSYDDGLCSDCAG